MAAAATAVAPITSTGLTDILLESQSPEQDKRRAAELQLSHAEANNFPAYLNSLAVELSTESLPTVARQLAGILLKNAISGTSAATDKIKRDRWLAESPEVTNPIKEAVLNTLKTNSEEVRAAVCQVVSKVGRLELALDRWPQLVPSLMQLVIPEDVPAAQRKAGVMAIAYLCEDINSLTAETSMELLQKEQKNTIMTAIVGAMRSSDVEIVLAGCKAFYHALLLARENMENEEERTFMFRVVGECFESPSIKVQHAAWECVLQMASEYYEFLDNYASTLGEHSLRTIRAAIAMTEQGRSEEEKTQTEAVALAALEFWSTVCDVEIMIEEMEGDKSSHHFIAKAKDVLLPVLFDAMTKQSTDEVDMDEWTLSMAAGTCIGLCAQVLRDDILQPALLFVNSNFLDEDWRKREAAVLAYGSIMEGPTSEKLAPIVQQSFKPLCNALIDRSVAVRDTTAWTIGRIAGYHTECVVGLLGSPKDPQLLQVLLERLQDEPRVASFVCFALHEIARNIRDSSGAQTLTDRSPPLVVTKLDVYFRDIAQKLLHVAQRPDALESNLRANAFEALAEVVDAVGDDDVPGSENESPSTTMVNILRELVLWLEQSLNLPTSGSDEVLQLQGLICGCLNNIFARLGKKFHDGPMTETLFNLFIRVINSALTASAKPGPDGIVPNATGPEGLGGSEERAKVGSEEDAVLAIGTLVRYSGPTLESLFPRLTPVLMRGLSQPSEVRFCRACIGVIAEVACTMETPLTPQALACMQELVPALMTVLQDPSAPISLKPPLMTTVGDAAVAMETEFAQYLPMFMSLLGQAATTAASDQMMNEELMEYFLELRDSILEAYSSLIHGLGSQPSVSSHLKHYVNGWLQLIGKVIQDEYSSESNICKAIEVTSDLVTAYRSELVNHIAKMPFYAQMLQRGSTSKDEGVRRKTSFLQNAVQRVSVKA